MSDTDGAQSLAELYRQCTSGFEHLLSCLNNPDLHILRRESLPLDILMEDYGKLRIWAEQTRVFLPPGSRSSLDELVRDRAKTKRIVFTTLRQLLNLLKSAEATFNDSTEYHDIPRTITTPEPVTLDLKTSEIDRNSGISSINLQPQPKFSTTMHHVSEQVRLLYSASVLLKRPGLTGKYLRSNTSASNDKNSLQEFLPFDQGHIQEKLLQWYDEWAAHNQEGYRGRTSSAAAIIQVPEELTLRLARANIWRRKQLRYWLRHADAPESTLTVVNDESRVQIQNTVPSSKINEVIIPEVQKATTAPSEAAKTTKSKVSFSTAVVSEMNDAQEDELAHTEYEESLVGMLKSTRVPPLPRAASESTDFKFPYCGLSLRSSVMRSRRIWKLHVYRDLRPYVCTFLDCTSATKLYHSRHDWVYHENQMHRRQWVCSDSCHRAFPNQQLFTEHLRHSHPERYIEDQLSLVITLSERPMNDDKVDCCPLCPTNLPLTDLYPHVAQHLEQLSLFVLSYNVDDTDHSANGSKASGQAHDDRSSHFLDTPESSSTAGVFDLERDIQKADSAKDDTKSTTKEDLDDLPPITEDPSDWMSISGNKLQSVDPDPVLLDYWKKQNKQIKAEDAIGDETEDDAAEEHSEFRNDSELLDYIERSLTTSKFHKMTQYYMLRPIFERITSQAVIRQVIKESKDLYLDKKTLYRFSRQVYTGCRRLFAVCVFGEVPISILKSLMESGLSDAHFPLSIEDCPDQMDKRRFRQRFVNNQELFRTPYFELGSFQALDGGLNIPIDFHESDFLDKFACGKIYRVYVHPDQHSFPLKHKSFAMRVYHSNAVYIPAMVQILLQVQDPHIVQCLAAFTWWSHLHILCEKGDYNLEQYMLHTPSSQLDDRLLLYQLSRIAGALRRLHNGDFSNQTEDDRPTDPPKLVALNITPEEIIVFSGETLMMRLSVRLSEMFREQVSNAMPRSLTPIYEAPERLIMEESKSVIKANIWSLGCTYLEILVWHIDGYPALSHFRQNRQQLVKPDGREDKGFYYFAETGPNARAQIRESVIKMFQSLLDRTQGSMQAAVQIVETMLRVDPSARPTAAMLEVELGKLES